MTIKTQRLLARAKKLTKKGQIEESQKIYENGLNEEEDVEQLEITLGNLKTKGHQSSTGPIRRSHTVILKWSVSRGYR